MGNSRRTRSACECVNWKRARDEKIFQREGTSSGRREGGGGLRASLMNFKWFLLEISKANYPRARNFGVFGAIYIFYCRQETGSRLGLSTRIKKKKGAFRYVRLNFDVRSICRINVKLMLVLRSMNWLKLKISIKERRNDRK